MSSSNPAKVPDYLSEKKIEEMTALWDTLVHKFMEKDLKEIEARLARTNERIGCTQKEIASLQQTNVSQKTCFLELEEKIEVLTNAFVTFCSTQKVASVSGVETPGETPGSDTHSKESVQEEGKTEIVDRREEEKATTLVLCGTCNEYSANSFKCIGCKTRICEDCTSIVQKISQENTHKKKITLEYCMTCFSDYLVLKTDKVTKAKNRSRKELTSCDECLQVVTPEAIRFTCKNPQHPVQFCFSCCNSHSVVVGRTINDCLHYSKQEKK